MSPDRTQDRAAAAVIERLRETRRRREPGVRLDEALAAQTQRLRTMKRRLGSAGSAWSSCCPPEFAQTTTPRALRSGVLTVAVDDASVRYRVDRWLRAGGLEALQRACPASLRRVRLEHGARGAGKKER